MQLKEKLAKGDIRDNRQVFKEMDIKLVSSATLEALLLFIGAIEGEVVPLSEMDAKFNA